MICQRASSAGACPPRRGACFPQQLRCCCYMPHNSPAIREGTHRYYNACHGEVRRGDARVSGSCCRGVLVTMR